jgi:hypothetical protein
MSKERGLITNDVIYGHSNFNAKWQVLNSSVQNKFNVLLYIKRFVFKKEIFSAQENVYLKSKQKNQISKKEGIFVIDKKLS